MTICKVDYCDFIVWTPDLYNEQRIKRDGRFCDQMFATAREFFLREILPEFSSKLFTREQRHCRQQTFTASFKDPRQGRSLRATTRHAHSNGFTSYVWKSHECQRQSGIVHNASKIKGTSMQGVPVSFC